MAETIDLVLPVSELLQETAKAITSEVEMEKLVQRITDLATEHSGAQFGAFFYNVENQTGEKYVLYTISGVAKEAFSKFPMPRNTKIFSPTFTGQGTVRYDDVTKQSHYGQNAPYHGMPKGHLPVRSYLATPVISPIDKEVIGGLFFGHSTPGVFTERSEKIIEGIALQASIAMGNAKLFEEKKKAEQVLLEQKNQYYSIFHSTFDGIIIFNKDGGIVEANNAAYKMLGYENGKLLRMNGTELMQNPKHFLGIKDLVYSGRKYDNVGVFVGSDKVPFDVHLMCTDFIYKEEPHLLAVVRDISAEKQKEEALEKSEEFSQIIANASPVALWMLNNEGKLVYVNETWLDWTGQTIEDVLEAGMKESLHPEDIDRLVQYVAAVFEKRATITVEFRIINRNGEVRWCAAKGAPYYNKKGIFQGYTGSTMDITERKLTEKKLESQNVLINTITNNTQYALFMMDDKQRCTYMNPAAEQMTGYKLHEVQEKPLHYYIHHTHPDGRHFPIEECPIDRALPTKMQTTGEDFFIHKNGSFYPVAFTASPIIDNGIPIGTVIEARDTTEERRIQAELHSREQKEKERLEEKVKERTAELEKINYELLQFTSVASHDLKEPLRKISVFADMLKDKLEQTTEPAVQKYLSNILNSSKRMTALIDDLLTFSRLSQTNTSFQPVCLNSVVAQIISDLEITIKEKSAVINTTSLPTVKGVPLQLGQVFQNLISNSLKFAHPERTPVIDIKCDEVVKNERSFYKIVYQDNGIGFKADYAEKIFDLFQRLHTRDEYEGTGIGLAIVKKIVLMHGGDISAEGVENKGARFEILLPNG